MAPQLVVEKFSSTVQMYCIVSSSILFGAQQMVHSLYLKMWIILCVT